MGYPITSALGNGTAIASQYDPLSAAFQMLYGAEFTATPVCEWLSRLEVTTTFIEPGSLWENRY
jgi:hypothetical protein